MQRALISQAWTVSLCRTRIRNISGIVLDTDGLTQKFPTRGPLKRDLQIRAENVELLQVWRWNLEIVSLNSTAVSAKKKPMPLLYLCLWKPYL